jgi:hypothetical protein
MAVDKLVKRDTNWDSHQLEALFKLNSVTVNILNMDQLPLEFSFITSSILLHTGR